MVVRYQSEKFVTGGNVLSFRMKEGMKYEEVVRNTAASLEGNGLKSFHRRPNRRCVEEKQRASSLSLTHQLHVPLFLESIIFLVKPSCRSIKVFIVANGRCVMSH